MIRNFMRITFPKVLDVLFAISIVGVVIAAFTAGAIPMQYTYGSFSFMSFIAVLISGIVGIIVAFGVIYVLLDIRDALQGRKQE